MEYVYDIIGLIGVALIIIAYLLLQTNRLQAANPVYSAMNGLGALLIIISLLINWNLSAFIVEIFWLLISLYGLAKYFRHKRQPPQP
jgi:predicted membrane protein